ANAIATAEVVERTVDRTLTVWFPYMVTNDIMKIIKDEQPTVEAQNFDNLCSVRLSIRANRAEGLFAKLAKVEGAALEEE
ncbi:MAG: YigZ family protein, partial [Alistipes sp.]